MAGNGAAATDLGCCIAMARRACRPIRICARLVRTGGAGGRWLGRDALARLLGDGDESVPDDPERAFASSCARATRGASRRRPMGWRSPIGTGSAPRPTRPGRAAVMTRAATAGFPRALNDLGVMGKPARAARPDASRAAELYEAAARAGDALGAWNLADCC
jgi:TPR repeat protein